MSLEREKYEKCLRHLEILEAIGGVCGTFLFCIGFWALMIGWALWIFEVPARRFFGLLGLLLIVTGAVWVAIAMFIDRITERMHRDLDEDAQRTARISKAMKEGGSCGNG